MSSLDEIWQQVERFCIEGDRNGLLVAADALAELGEEDMGQTIRWMIRTQKELPELVVYGGPHPSTWRVPIHHPKARLSGPSWHWGRRQALIWAEINTERLQMLEFYK